MTSVVGVPLGDREAQGDGPGARASRYVPLELVGRGGMGEVVRAYDPKLQREVALKAVRAGAIDRDARAQMLREARAMARLSHANVVGVYDAEETRDGVVLVMEYVPGSTLRHWVRDEERPWSEIVERFIAAGRGLAAAHGVGLLHRDFKPSNVLVSDAGAVKVTDFGLAKPAGTPSPSADASADALALPSQDGLDAALTSADTVIGTPRYMAPEQHRGDPLTPAVDQYAFCIALWEALVGDPPFADSDQLSLRASKEQGPPTWPPGRAVPRAVIDAVRRGLAADPRDRHPSMEELLSALVLDPRARARRTVTVVAAAGVLALVASSSYWRDGNEPPCTGAGSHLQGVWDDATKAEVRAAFRRTELPYADRAWSHAEAVLDRHAAGWVALHTEACEATALRGEQSSEVLDLRMGCLHRSNVELAALTGVLRRADADVVQKAHELAGALPYLADCSDVDALRSDVKAPEPDEQEAVEHIRAQIAEAQAERAAGHLSVALTHVAAAREALSSISYEPVRTEIALEEGNISWQLGNHETAASALKEALASAARWRQWGAMQEAAETAMYVVGFEEGKLDEGFRYRELAEGLAGGDPLRQASFRSTLANLLFARGEYAAAEAENRAALELRQQALPPDHTDITRSLNNLAGTLHAQGDYEGAEAAFRSVLARWEAAAGPEHPNVAASHNNLATVELAKGRHAEAETEFRTAIATWEKSFGPGHPHVSLGRGNLASVLAAQGKLDEAEAENRRALAGTEAAMGPEHPDVARAHNNLGGLLLARGKVSDAEREVRLALAKWEAALGPEHPDVAVAHANLARMLLAQGKLGEAESECRRGLELAEESLGADHPDVASMRDNLGQVLRERGELEQAEAELRRALEARRAVLGDEHPFVAASRTHLAEALLELGRGADAEPLAQLAWRSDEPAVASGERAQTAFVLARCLWSTGTDAERRARARSLARRALEFLEEGGVAHVRKATTVRAWLERHGGG